MAVTEAPHLDKLHYYSFPSLYSITPFLQHTCLIVDVCIMAAEYFAIPSQQNLI